MTLLNLSTILGYAGAISGSIAVIPQIIRVIKLQNAHSLSYVFLSLRMFAFLCFMFAVTLTKHYMLASSYILIIATNSLLVYLKIKYDKQSKSA